MSSRIGVAPTRIFATSIALAFALCLLGVHAWAQDIQPKDEIFGGYSWLHPGGYVDYGVKVHDITKGFDVSNTYYLSRAHNLGFIADGSFHFDGKRDTDVYFGFGGLQYKWHTDTFSPFARVLIGAARISPPTYVDQWQFAAGAGGGFDLNVTHFLAIRLAQADYIYTNYDALTPGHSKQWNSVRLASGLVLNLGNYYAPPPTATCSATPTEVFDGEPVKVTATGAGFNPKHTVTYAWTTNGGKVTGADAQTATIDTTGVTAGSYSANATVADPKLKKFGSATCSAAYTVKARPMNPPQVTCSANPTSVKSGDPSTITASASSPDNSQITGYAYQASAGTISGTGTTATLDTTGASPGAITVTVTATDARNLTGTCTTTVTVEAPPEKPQVTKINDIAFPDAKRPWRVDNTAKAILDDVASRLKADPNAKIVIVGYADGEKAPMIGKGKKRHAMDLAAQRAVNAKAYLVQQQGIDPSRVEVRSGTGQQKLASIFWVPQGADTSTAPVLQGTTPVDESVVTPSENAYPKPRTAAPAHHRRHAAAPAAPAAGSTPQ
jgi:outer membrane protein OmpA-like peptidoglycan-associated protein